MESRERLAMNACAAQVAGLPRNEKRLDLARDLRRVGA